MKAFISQHPEYETRPLYIFCESYGGKMTVAMALAIQSAVSQGELKANLTGIGLGDAWISPIDYCNTWGPYVYAFSLINEMQLQKLDSIVEDIRKALTDGKGTEATDLWDKLERYVMQYNIIKFSYTSNADFYNVLKHSGDQLKNKGDAIKYHLKAMSNDEVDDLMNSEEMRKKLGIPNNVTFGGQRDLVFYTLSEDFMNPVIDDVDTV